MRSVSVRLSIAAVLLSASAAAPAGAQAVADVRGPHFGAAINASSIKFDETAFSSDERENGYGVTLYAGYNFTRNLGLTLGVTGSNINDSDTEDFSLGHVDLAGRASFPGRSALVPYLEVSLAGVGAKYDSDGGEVKFEGAGIGLGGGLNYFFSPRAAFDANFRYTAGEFGKVKINGREIDSGDGVGFNTTRLNIGFAFYP